MCSSLGWGRACSTRLLAASLNMPVGFPSRSRTMTPPGTSFVFLSTPELHGQRVRQTHVPIGTIHEDRIVGRDIIDQLMRRQSCRSPPLVVPVAVQNPFALGTAAREIGDLFAELSRTGSFMQLHAGKTVSSHVEVHMGVIETGDDAAPSQIDHCGLWTSQRKYGRAVPDGNDAVSRNGNRLGLRLLRIFRPNLSVR